MSLISKSYFSGLLYVLTIAASAFTYSSGPLFFELAAEEVYPAPEGLVGGVLTCVYNSVGMAFLLLFYIPELSKYRSKARVNVTVR